MTGIRSGGSAAGNVQAAALGGAALAGAPSAGASSAGAVAQAVMSDIVGKMAGSISSALNLANADAAGQWQGNGSDPYQVDEMTESLAEQLGGSASDIGNLSRSLHEFVQEGAALFVARPESRSLDILKSAIDDSAQLEIAASLASVAAQIDAATSDLRQTA